MVKAIVDARRLRDLCSRGLRLSRLALYPVPLFRRRRRGEERQPVAPGRFRFFLGLRPAVARRRRGGPPRRARTATRAPVSPRLGSHGGPIVNPLRTVDVLQHRWLLPPSGTRVTVVIEEGGRETEKVLDLYREEDLDGYTPWFSWPRPPDSLIGVIDPRESGMEGGGVLLAAFDGRTVYVSPFSGQLQCRLDMQRMKNNIAAYNSRKMIKVWGIVRVPKFSLEDIFKNLHGNERDGREMLLKERHIMRCVPSPTGGHEAQQQAVVEAYKVFHIANDYVPKEKRGKPDEYFDGFPPS